MRASNVVLAAERTVEMEIGISAISVVTANAAMATAKVTSTRLNARRFTRRRPSML
jgi:hypothetical protein